MSQPPRQSPQQSPHSRAPDACRYCGMVHQDGDCDDPHAAPPETRGCAACGGTCPLGCADPLVLAGRARTHALDDMREALRVLNEAETALKEAASRFHTARKHFDAVKSGTHPEPRRSE